MKKQIKFVIALVVLTGVIGVIGTVASFADEGAPKCNCYYPNTGVYGVKNGDDCPATECWVEMS